jgi:hypothetical protein
MGSVGGKVLGGTAAASNFSKGDSTSGSDALEAFASNVQKDTAPVRDEFSRQLMEALTTGGVGARIPIIQNAVEQSRMAAANTQSQLGDQLGLSGLKGTPFGVRAMAESLQSGNQAVARAPIDIIRDLLGQVPNFITAQGQQQGAALAGASSAEAQTRAAQLQAAAQIFSSSIFHV